MWMIDGQRERLQRERWSGEDDHGIGRREEARRREVARNHKRRNRRESFLIPKVVHYIIYHHAYHS